MIGGFSRLYSYDFNVINMLFNTLATPCKEVPTVPSLIATKISYFQRRASLISPMAVFLFMC